jgi:fumarylacetoacetate (FAA) hydrolase
MKLSTLQDGTRDGRLVVVSRDLARAIEVPAIARTMQAALDNWTRNEPELKRVFAALEAGPVEGQFPFNEDHAHSPLPRAYQWCEGSVYLVHLERCRRATNRELPQILYQEIGMYQGGSDSFLAPHAPIPVRDDNWDVDLEAGICIITDDVPMGVSIADAVRHIKLIVLTNDVSLRGLQAAESAKGLGAIQCKPANSFSPVAVTPEGLGKSWTGTMLARPIKSYVNGRLLGEPEGHVDAYFDFPQLIAHLARTRNIAAGSIIGAGTVANRDERTGSSCILERRAVELLETGSARTPFLKYGDCVRIESEDEGGQSIFGAINQTIMRAP